MKSLLSKRVKIIDQSRLRPQVFDSHSHSIRTSYDDQKSTLDCQVTIQCRHRPIQNKNLRPSNPRYDKEQVTYRSPQSEHTFLTLDNGIMEPLPMTVENITLMNCSVN